MSEGFGAQSSLIRNSRAACLTPPQTWFGKPEDASRVSAFAYVCQPLRMADGPRQSLASRARGCGLG